MRACYRLPTPSYLLRVDGGGLGLSERHGGKAVRTLRSRGRVGRGVSPEQTSRDFSLPFKNRHGLLLGQRAGRQQVGQQVRVDAPLGWRVT